MTFGQVVLKDMETIYEESNKDDEETVKRIGLYFGYLYWTKTYIEKGKLGGERNESFK